MLLQTQVPFYRTDASAEFCGVKLRILLLQRDLSSGCEDNYCALVVYRLALELSGSHMCGISVKRYLPISVKIKRCWDGCNQAEYH